MSNGHVNQLLAPVLDAISGKADRRDPANAEKRAERHALLQCLLTLERIERRLNKNENMCILEDNELKPMLQMIRHSLEMVYPVIEKKE